MSAGSLDRLPYSLDSLPRELKRHYIGADEADVSGMLAELGLSSLNDLFQHIPEHIQCSGDPDIEEELDYQDLVERVETIAAKNVTSKLNFLGDGLQQYSQPEICKYVLGLRQLTTAYTPYQPERSQGTLISHWIYQCVMSMLTGFEAINVSMYDRSTTLYEAILTGIRLAKSKKKVLIADNLYQGDIEVIETLRQGTSLDIDYVSANPETGLLQCSDIEAKLDDSVGVLVFSHINTLGLIEDVDALTNLCSDKGLKSIAVVDPMLLATGGLKPPAEFGEQGVDLFVAEGQHLALGPIGGGPGLGVFGVRFNQTKRNDIRSTPGRYIGKADDIHGRPCLAQVISTREQHIRREKATSNICSNQAYIATLAGSAVLARGEKGMSQACAKGRENALAFVKGLAQIADLNLAFPQSAFYNEVLLSSSQSPATLIEKAQAQNILLGVAIEAQGKSYLKVSFSDLQSNEEIEALLSFLKTELGSGEQAITSPEVPAAQLRQTPVGLPSHSHDDLVKFYGDMAQQNISPDHTIYPLGSCTMKYNPYINDYAAGLQGFVDTHPQAPEAMLQGNLEIMYQTQEDFKAILGLAALTTQPVAGAQGELVGLKMIQAYHRDRGDLKRDIVLIPRSAHGTNPATVTVAGFETKSGRNGVSGVVLVEADQSGKIDKNHLAQLIEEHGERVAAIMVTNPNTSGLFETDFQSIAQMIHDCGGLVYMDGANLNAIAGWVDLGKMGVDAVHSNTHKTWSIPHGGGGPGDAFVAVSETLTPFLPGHQVVKTDAGYVLEKAPKSIGSFHRHFGNFGHKVRCYTYVKRLGKQGIRQMSAIAVLASRYLKQKFVGRFEILPNGALEQPCMHEFILSLPAKTFQKIIDVGIPKANVISRVGKLFLDFGYYGPTVAFPEVYGIMIEPTESYSKAELDRFSDAVLAIIDLIETQPEVLLTAPHFTPVDRVDDVKANRNLILSENLKDLPKILNNRISPDDLGKLPIAEIRQKILEAHQNVSNS